MSINETHLGQLRGLSEAHQTWVGATIKSWWDYVVGDVPTNLPDARLNREELKKIAQHDSGFGNAEVFGAVKAWGGMNRQHAQLSIMKIDGISDVIEGLRTNKLSRSEGFSQFHLMRMNKNLPGMTAAYFTKLIFFCSPSHDGYIMDQWTSKSVNLLYDDQTVRLSSKGFVTDKNDADIYELFCQRVEGIARHLNCSPEEAEVRMFSAGRGKGRWRNYVKAHWGMPVTGNPVTK